MPAYTKVIPRKSRKGRRTRFDSRRAVHQEYKLAGLSVLVPAKLVPIGCAVVGDIIAEFGLRCSTAALALLFILSFCFILLFSLFSVDMAMKSIYSHCSSAVMHPLFIRWMLFANREDTGHT